MAAAVARKSGGPASAPQRRPSSSRSPDPCTRSRVFVLTRWDRVMTPSPPLPALPYQINLEVQIPPARQAVPCRPMTTARYLQPRDNCQASRAFRISPPATDPAGNARAASSRLGSWSFSSRRSRISPNSMSFLGRHAALVAAGLVPESWARRDPILVPA